jgi:hypothetical protein
MSIPPAGTPIGDPLEAPNVEQLRPVPIYSDFVDPNSGEITKLNRTHPPVVGAVIEALRVERNSGPAVASVGHKLGTIRHADEFSLVTVRSLIKASLRELETDGLVELVKIEISGEGDEGTLTAEIRDRTRNDANSRIVVPLERGAR